MSNVISISDLRGPVNPAIRGYQPVYHSNEVNRCPGCGRTHWLIGRLLAECAFCALRCRCRTAELPAKACSGFIAHRARTNSPPEVQDL